MRAARSLRRLRAGGAVVPGWLRGRWARDGYPAETCFQTKDGCNTNVILMYLFRWRVARSVVGRRQLDACRSLKCYRF